MKNDIAIDRTNMIEEWEKQPLLALEYYELLAAAEEQRNISEDDLDLLYAAVELETRQNANKEGGKFTEGTIKALVEADERIVKARQELTKKIRVLSDAKALVQAIEHKKKSLDRISDMLLNTNGHYIPAKSDQEVNHRQHLNRRFKDEET